MCENWKDIVGFEGLYMVSDLGRVKSLEKYVRNGENSYRIIPEKILTNKKKKHGYMFIGLYKDKKPKYYHIHRLVADAFLDNPLNKEQVNHKNGVRDDNKLSNLEWTTCSENHQHASKILKRKYTSGTLNKFSENNKLSIKVDQYSKDGVFIKTWNCIKDVERELGIDNSTISGCCKKKYGYKSAGGFLWEYNK